MRKLVFLIVAACGGGSSSEPGSVVPGLDASTDAASPIVDASSLPTDASTNDGGATGDTCTGTYDKTCKVVGDCLMVSKGCYCGAQPIIGVSKTAQMAAQQCENDAGAQCTRGCANAPGHVGEDGKNDEGTGKNLQVICDNGQCKTQLEP